jgi:flagellar FliL protein
MDDEQVETEPVAAKKGGGALKKLILIGGVVLALGGGTAYWFMAGSSASAQVEEVNLEERGVVLFETFLVNLSDPGGNRFLKVTLSLVFDSAGDATHVTENPSLMSHARSAILELLTEQNAQALVTAEGKQKLKDDIKARAGDVLKKQKVVDVLFSEFVVQF